MSFSDKDKWLMNAEVRSKIDYKNGRWLVSLLFIDTSNPNRFLIREINDFRSKRLAEIAALNMKNTAAKDMRGTQKVKENAYNYNKN